MTNRICGACDVCCKGWLNADINGEQLSPGNQCSKLTDKGCGIYETRPESPCRTFICAWLQNDSPLPEDFRPDKSGAIVMLDRQWKGWETIRAFPTGKKVPEETLALLMKLARETKTPLIYYENIFDRDKFIDRKAKGYGPAAFVEAVKRNVNKNDINILVENS